jgi:hypothetical protein
VGQKALTRPLALEPSLLQEVLPIGTARHARHTHGTHTARAHNVSFLEPHGRACDTEYFVFEGVLDGRAVGVVVGVLLEDLLGGPPDHLQEVGQQRVGLPLGAVQLRCSVAMEEKSACESSTHIHSTAHRPRCDGWRRTSFQMALDASSE